MDGFLLFLGVVLVVSYVVVEHLHAWLSPGPEEGPPERPRSGP